MAKTASIQDHIRLAKAMNDMLMQDYAMIPLIHRGGVSAHSNTISGVRMNGWDSELWNIADWKRNEAILNFFKKAVCFQQAAASRLFQPVF